MMDGKTLTDILQFMTLFYNPYQYGFTYIQYLFFALALLFLYRFIKIWRLLAVEKANLPYLFAIVLTGFLLRISMSPSNLFDPNLHGIEQLVAATNSMPQEYGPSNYMYGVAFSNLINLIFRIIKPSIQLALNINLFLSCANIALIYFMTRLLLRDNIAALFAALIYAVLPVDIRYALSDSKFIFLTSLFMLGTIMVLMLKEEFDAALFMILLIINAIIVYCYPLSLLYPVYILILLVVFKIPAYRFFASVPRSVLFAGIMLFSLPPYFMVPTVRTVQYVEGSHLYFFKYYNIFLNSLCTPAVFVGLYIVGIGIMFYKKLFKELILIVIATAVFSYPFFTFPTVVDGVLCDNYYFQQHLLQFLYVPAIAISLSKIVTLFPLKALKGLSVACIVAFLLSVPFAHHTFIGKLYNYEREYSFLQKSLPSIYSEYAYLASSSSLLRAMTAVDNPRYPFFIHMNAVVPQENKPPEIQESLKNVEKQLDVIRGLLRNKEAVYYYLSEECYTFHLFFKKYGDVGKKDIRPECAYFIEHVSMTPHKEMYIEFPSEVLLPFEYYTNVKKIRLQFFRIEKVL